MTATHRPRTPNRPATEAALQDAALELMERNGVLAGLNLREVADEAGVNRGLVYHYFGTRRDLLRAALRRDVEQRLADFTPAPDEALPERYQRFLRTAIAHRQAIVLGLLLVLDGDKGVQMAPERDTIFELMAGDVERGHLPEDVSPVGLHAALASLVYGYTALRDRLADELGVDGDALDGEVGDAVAKLLGSVATDTSP